MAIPPFENVKRNAKSANFERTGRERSCISRNAHWPRHSSNAEDRDRSEALRGFLFPFINVLIRPLFFLRWLFHGLFLFRFLSLFGNPSELVYSRAFFRHHRLPHSSLQSLSLLLMVSFAFCFWMRRWDSVLFKLIFLSCDENSAMILRIIIINSRNPGIFPRKRGRQISIVKRTPRFRLIPPPPFMSVFH